VKTKNAGTFMLEKTGGDWKITSADTLVDGYVK
jgi:hypothetical protein